MRAVTVLALDGLAFTVKPPGYTAPKTPGQMKNMPKASARER